MEKSKSFEMLSGHRRFLANQTSIRTSLVPLGDFPEVIRLDEDPVLKTGDCASGL